MFDEGVVCRAIAAASGRIDAAAAAAILISISRG